MPFELNFGRHLQKVDLTVKTELPKLENFLEGLQKSWDTTRKLMEMEKEAIKKQFNRKRQNLQELKAGDNVWLEAKNIQFN